MANQERPGEVAVILRDARLRCGYSVRALAPRIIKQSGVAIGASYITDIEKGRSVPSDHIAKQMASLLALDEQQFLSACERDRGLR